MNRPVGSAPDASDGEPVYWQESAGDELAFYLDEAPGDDGIRADSEADCGKRWVNPKTANQMVRNLTRVETEPCLRE